MPGASCTSSPTPWPRPWKNPSESGLPGSFVRCVFSPAASKMSHVPSKMARPSAPSLISDDRAVERLLAEPVPLAHVVGHLADDERPRHVAEAEGLVVARPDVDHDRHAGRIGPEPMSCPTAPCGPGATMKSSAVQPLRRTPRHRDLHALDGQRLAVELETRPVRSRAAAGRAPRPSRPRRRAGRAASRRARPPS